MDINDQIIHNDIVLISEIPSSEFTWMEENNKATFNIQKRFTLQFIVWIRIYFQLINAFAWQRHIMIYR